MPKRGAVIVSGGTYGIGRQIVIELASRGHPVVAFGLEARQPGSLAEDGIAATRALLSEAGLEADLLEADVSSAGDVDRVVQHALREHGSVAALVNNAAIRPTGDVLDTDEATFDRVLAVNQRAHYTNVEDGSHPGGATYLRFQPHGCHILGHAFWNPRGSISIVTHGD